MINVISQNCDFCDVELIETSVTVSQHCAAVAALRISPKYLSEWARFNPVQLQGVFEQFREIKYDEKEIAKVISVNVCSDHQRYRMIIEMALSFYCPYGFGEAHKTLSAIRWLIDRGGEKPHILFSEEECKYENSRVSLLEL